MWERIELLGENSERKGKGIMEKWSMEGGIGMEGKRKWAKRKAFTIST